MYCTCNCTFLLWTLLLSFPLLSSYLFYCHFSIFLLSLSSFLYFYLCVLLPISFCSRDPIPQISLRSELQHLLARPHACSRETPVTLSFSRLFNSFSISITILYQRYLRLDTPSPLRETTAKVSSLLVPRARAISFPPEVDTGSSQRLTPDANMSQTKSGRRRRSSSIIYQEPAESLEHTSDQAALPNLNANWVNAKG